MKDENHGAILNLTGLLRALTRPSLRADNGYGRVELRGDLSGFLYPALKKNETT